MKKFASILLSALLVTVVANAGGNIYQAVPMGGEHDPFPFKKAAPLPWKKAGDSIRTINPDGSFYDFSPVTVRGSEGAKVVKVSLIDAETGRVIATGAGSVQYQVLVAQIVKDGRLVTLELKAYYSSTDTSDVRMVLSETDEYSSLSRRYCLVDNNMLQSRKRTSNGVGNLCR